MYAPPAFREDRADMLFGAIRAHPLGTLVTSGAGGLLANLIPFTLVETGGAAILRAHLAKANDQIADLRAGAPTLVLFQGPHGYVSPSWYATKAEHGRVVPTWNYIAVQIAGEPRILDDADWLREQLEALTDAQEGARAEPWRVGDAPAAFVAGQMKGIVGLEIRVERIEGKWKVSQNQPAANRAGVVAGLCADGNDPLAEAVRERR
ncbi:FMN-binding negative transcriptional regulator [Sphingomonas sp. Y38-1Y]|uniref:FMN-binding negative transcriptional regulator n=1 Tax=Sphingomonas sp. Y38-1Y TaxID=3078265 RepID=UPI0028E6DAA8|nr:FMN-binding negative transcriptional regulator [Sphingomonas sp. Y38-1Y]